MKKWLITFLAVFILAVPLSAGAVAPAPPSWTAYDRERMDEWNNLIKAKYIVEFVVKSGANGDANTSSRVMISADRPFKLIPGSYGAGVETLDGSTGRFAYYIHNSGFVDGFGGETSVKRDTNFMNGYPDVYPDPKTMFNLAKEVGKIQEKAVQTLGVGGLLSTGLIVLAIGLGISLIPRLVRLFNPFN